MCVVACPKGECRLAQGNYRAEVRVRMVRKLLGEIGLEPERSELLHCSPEDSFDSLEESVHQAVNRLCALGPTFDPGDANESVAGGRGTRPLISAGRVFASHDLGCVRPQSLIRNPCSCHKRKQNLSCGSNRANRFSSPR